MARNIFYAYIRSGFFFFVGVKTASTKSQNGNNLKNIYWNIVPFKSNGNGEKRIALFASATLIGIHASRLDQILPDGKCKHTMKICSMSDLKFN